MKMLKTLAGALALSAMLAGSAAAQGPEKKDLTLGVGGKGLLYYLQLTLTERLGYFKEQGLNVTVTDFGGGAKSLQSLIGGSADVVTGAYEHTIRMQVKGQPIQAVIEMGRFPGIVLAVRKEKAAQVKSFKDLKGFKIGVTAPGSSTNFFVNALIAKEGLKPEDVSIIGVGTGSSAVAAMKKGEHRRDLQSRSGDHQAAAGRRHRHHGGFAQRGRQQEIVRRQQPGGGGLP